MRNPLAHGTAVKSVPSHPAYKAAANPQGMDVGLGAGIARAEHQAAFAEGKSIARASMNTYHQTNSPGGRAQSGK